MQNKIIKNKSKQRLDTVLFIDDSQSCHDIANLFSIVEKNYRILTAYDWLKAKNLLNKHYSQIGLVLLDLNLPNNTGYEIYNFIKRSTIFDHINIVFQTGFTGSEEQIKENIKAYNINIIYKPYDHNMLKKIIKEFMPIKTECIVY